MQNILLIAELLRTFAKYTSLLPLVRQTIAAVRARDWDEVERLVKELFEKAGLSSGGPVRFGAAPSLGAMTECPDDVCRDLDEIAAEAA